LLKNFKNCVIFICRLDFLQTADKLNSGELRFCLNPAGLKKGDKK